eukprot:SAG11_NODE_770_length_7257_cov_2.448449_5_plen_88_part_00
MMWLNASTPARSHLEKGELSRISLNLKRKHVSCRKPRRVALCVPARTTVHAALLANGLGGLILPVLGAVLEVLSPLAAHLLAVLLFG